MRRYLIAGSCLVLLLCLSGAALGQETPPPPPPPTTTAEPAPPPPSEPAPATEQAAAEEAPPCSTCHEDQVKAFLHNPHARGAVVKGEVPNSTCETCHEGAEEHAKEADPTKVSKPVGFRGSEDKCMMCHDTVTDRVSRRAGMHSNTEQVNCLTCHSIHHANPGSPHLVARPQLALCGSCHTQAASTFNKPYAHRLDRGGMACSSCHEPHGRPAKSTRSLMMTNHLRATQSGEVPCTSCHAEKRGPFVFQHGAFSVGECTTCHETHGSTNGKMLRRAEVWQLCIECHSPTGSGTVGSQPPSFHNLNSPRYRNCTSCHVAIHGSNRDPQLFK